MAEAAGYDVGAAPVEVLLPVADLLVGNPSLADDLPASGWPAILGRTSAASQNISSAKVRSGCGAACAPAGALPAASPAYKSVSPQRS